MSARPRTVQNITGELHDVLAKLGAPKPYILVGHSIAGFYTLSCARRCPDEMSAVVGTDPTLPASEAGPAGTSGLPVPRYRSGPEDLLSTDSVASLPNWVRQHEDQLRNVRHHEVVVLDGGHYLHWTRSEALAEKITAFLDENLQR